MKKEILEWIIAIAVALIIVGLVQKFLFTSIPSQSLCILLLKIEIKLW